jgi:hypothetical protein
MKYLQRSENFLKYDHLNESMFYISNNFRKKLKSIDSPISKGLLSVVQTDVKPDMTFIDTTDKEGFVEFSQIDKGMKYLEEPTINKSNRFGYGTITYDLKKGGWFDENGHEIEVNISLPEDFGNFDNMKARNKVKVGKLINKIFPGKFTDKEIEEFVNKFKSKSSILKNEFELIKGKEIAKWYNCDSYASQKGTLGSSCMRHMDEDVFKIYTENPSVCRMLILKNEDEELLGRALLWKVEISDPELLGKVEYFMDRIYSIKDSDQNSFIEYADSKGWSYRSSQSYSYDNGLYYKGNFYQVNMVVNLEESEFSKYPYMDTFQSLDQYKDILKNNDNGPVILDSTTGSLGEWSDFYQESIPEEDAVYSEALNDWIWGYRSIYIKHSISGKEGHYPDTYDGIIYDDLSDLYIHIQDAVYSEYTGEYYYIENVISVITDVNSYGKVIEESWVHNEEEDVIHRHTLEDYDWFKKVDVVKQWSDYDGVIDNLLIRDYHGDSNDQLQPNDELHVIPKFLEVNTYDISDNDGEEWLTITDSFLLGKVGEYNFHKNPENFSDRIESTFEYFKRVWIKGDLDPFKYIDRKYIYNLDYIKELDAGLVIKSMNELGDMIRLYKEFHEFENPANKKEEEVTEKLTTSFNNFKIT